MNKIIIGSYIFTDEGENLILSGKVTMEHSVIGETLSADNLTIIVNSTHTGNHKLLTNSLQWYSTNTNQGFVIADTSIEAIPYATPATYYIDDILVGKFFVSSITRTGRDIFKIVCTSAVGLLINSNHLGGIYSNVNVANVLNDILTGITYTLDASFSSSTISGYLPVASRRDNLQQVLFAIGGAVRTELNGGLSIIPMSPTSVGEIDAERIYNGGKVETGKAYDGLQLTEHNYFISQEEETLFDDSIEGTQIVTFSNPHHSYAIEGGQIITSGANYVQIAPPSGSEYASVVVTGKKYTHTQRVLYRGDTTQTSSTNIMSISKATLANPQIADTLADRAWVYAQCNKTITQDIVVSNERAGDAVKVMNPYTFGNENALLTSMDINMSGVNKANAKFLLNYTPQGVISGFDYYTVITANSTWSKSGGYFYVNGVALKDGQGNPVEVDKIRIICVGGGAGGKNGSAGKQGGKSSWSNGDNYTSNDNTPEAGLGGEGGNGGAGGKGGNIFEISIDVDNNDSGNITIGSGGLGGETPTDGTDTSFTLGGSTYTSANGKKYPYGYVENKSGITLAETGASGIKGGNGGDGGAKMPKNHLTNEATAGEDIGTHTGGVPVLSGYDEESSYRDIYLSGYGGGGASATANGYSRGRYYNSIYNLYEVYGGKGANGGTNAPSTNYGAGGIGGNGGGGGGGAGVQSTYWGGSPIGISPYNYYSFEGAEGGIGGTGANGNNGCLVIYY